MNKKILIVNDEMIVGGVSKVLNNLLRHIDTDKYDISLLVLHYHGLMLKEIPSNINVIMGTKFFDVIDQPFKMLLKSCRFIKVIKKIRIYLLIKYHRIDKKIIKERNKMNLDNYDIEIAFKEGFCSIFTAVSDSIVKINWIHADYKVKNYAKNYMSYMKTILNKFTYNVAVSKVAARSFEEVFELDEEVIVIHNIIEYQEIINKSKEIIDYRDNKLTFITIGRLHPQKGYDRLLEITKRLLDEGYDFDLFIIGDGPLKKQFKTYINKNKLNDNVKMLGQQNNPYKYLVQADAFILTSVYEGLPTVVYESFILGVPVLAVDVAGVDEQIDINSGIVVDNDLSGIYNMMKYILDNTNKIDLYKLCLKKYKYDNDKIMDQIYNLLDI